MALPTNAQSTLTTGWDFSQYRTAGFSSLDGASPVDTLSANYSDYAKAETGAGPSAAPFGTLYYDGSFGSSLANPIIPFSEVKPTSTNLTSNQDIERHDSFHELFDPAFVGRLVPFNSLTTLTNEGQPFANEFGLSVTADSQMFSLVFESTLVGGEYCLFSFAGQSTGADINVTLELSDDGANYGFADSFVLTSSEQTFSTDLTSWLFGSHESLYARLNFDLDSADAVIDNVAFSEVVIPEVSVYSLFLGVAAFAFCAIKRRRHQSAPINR